MERQSKKVSERKHGKKPTSLGVLHSIHFVHARDDFRDLEIGHLEIEKPRSGFLNDRLKMTDDRLADLASLGTRFLMTFGCGLRVGRSPGQ